MTNLRPGVSAPLLTRERALVGAPLVLSGLVCFGLALAVVLPALGRIGELKTEVVDLEAKQASLPGLRAQLVKAEENQAMLLDQQTLLIDLIAGQDRIATFLALLEQEASATAVTIVRYQPQAPPPAPAPQRAGSRSQQAEQPPSDPLQTLGYRQTAVVLGVQGGYQALQTFLRRMEDLEILVEASDLQLQNRPASEPSQQQLMELGLRLSFFDRAPQPEADGNTPSTSDQ